MIKAIFWDNDGILVDTEYLYFQANQIVLKELGIELSLDFYIHQTMVLGKSVMILAQQLGKTEPEIDVLRNKKNQIYTELIQKQVRIMPDIESVLKHLYKKIFMAIVTSSRKDHFDIIHNHTGFKKYFDLIITHEDFVHTKPNPECYLLALRKSGFKNDECLVIEDTERGLKAAKSAELKCFVIPNDLTKNHNFSLADKILKNASELLISMKH